jgi:hypothetical protein
MQERSFEVIKYDFSAIKNLVSVLFEVGCEEIHYYWIGMVDKMVQYKIPCVSDCFGRDTTSMLIRDYSTRHQKQDFKDFYVDNEKAKARLNEGSWVIDQIWGRQMV